jgi:hypothetical protein
MADIHKKINIIQFERLFKEKWDYLTLLVLSFFFFQINTIAIYLLDDLFLGRNSDAWFNVGFMLHPQELFNTLPTGYYWDRLSWDVPGYLLFRAFSPDYAQYILHFSFFIIGIFSFFLICKQFFDKRTALVSSTLMMGFSPFLIYMGTNYVDPPVLTFFLLSLVMIAYLSNGNHIYLKLSLAGIFFTCMMIAQPVSLFLYIAAFIGVYYLQTKRWMGPQHIKGVISFFAGIFGTIVVFSVMFYLLTGSFTFLRGTFLFISQYNVGTNPWFEPWYVWVESFHYIILVFFILSIIVCILGKYSLKDNTHQLAFPLFFVIACMYFIVMTIKPNPSPILKNVFACLLFPLLFFSIAAILDTYMRKIKFRVFSILLGSEIIILGLPYIISNLNSSLIEGIIQLIFPDFLMLLISGFLLFLLLYIVSKNKKFKGNQMLNSIAVFITICIFFNFTFFNLAAEPGIFINNSHVDSYEIGFSSIISADQIIQQNNFPTYKKIVWYNATELNNMGNDYGGIFTTIGYTYESYGFYFPEYDLNNVTRTCWDSADKKCDKSIIYVLSTDPNLALDVKNNFQIENQTAILLKNEKISNGNINFNISILKIN